MTEPQKSYSYAQEPTARPYPEPNEASSHTFSHFPSYVNLIFQTGLLAAGFLIKLLCALALSFNLQVAVMSSVLILINIIIFRDK